MIFCHIKYSKEANEFLQKLHLLILIFCFRFERHSQKSKYTVVPGTQTKPWIDLVHYLNSTQLVTSKFHRHGPNTSILSFIQCLVYLGRSAKICYLSVWQWFTSRGSYVHIFGEILGGIPIFFFLIKILMVSDKTIHKAFRAHKTL